MTDNIVTIGHNLGPAERRLGLEPHIIADDALKPHVTRSYLLKWLQDYYGPRVGALTAPPPEPDDEPSDAHLLTVTADELARHTLIVGASGSGKSYFIRSLCRQFFEQPGSTIVIDPKGHLVEQLATDLTAMGCPPERLVLLDPSIKDPLPAWNPIEVTDGKDVSQLVGDLVTIVHRSVEAIGPRMGDILTNALYVLAARRLTLFELRYFLVDDAYRQSVLNELTIQNDANNGQVPASRGSRPVGTRAGSLDSVTATEVRQFWEQEFARFGKGKRATAINPVLNRIRDLTRNPYLRALTCRAQSTVDFSEVMREGKIVLINLKSTELGEEATKLLASMLVSKIYRTAAERGVGNHLPCTLIVDELAMFTRVAGDSIQEILETARGFGLRLVLATQHFAQMSDTTLASVMANTHMQVYMNLGHDDAKRISEALLSRETTRAQFLELRSSDKWVTVRKELLTASGRRVKVNHPEILRALVKRGAQKAARQLHQEGKTYVTLAGFDAFAQEWGLTPLTVEDDLTRELVTLEQYLPMPNTARVLLAPPLAFVEIYFPHADLVKRERFTEGAVRDACAHTLSNQARQSAFVRVKGQPVARVRTLDVDEPDVSAATVKRLQVESLLMHGQNAAEVEADIQRRQAEIDRRVNGGMTVAPAFSPTPSEKQTARRETPTRTTPSSNPSKERAASAPPKPSKKKSVGQSQKKRSIEDVIVPAIPLQQEGEHEIVSLE